MLAHSFLIKSSSQLLVTRTVHKSLVKFYFGPDQTTHFGVTCPWVTKTSNFWTWLSLKPVGQSWSNFMCSIIGVGERLHKVFGTDWPWHIGLRWAIIALWATSFLSNSINQCHLRCDLQLILQIQLIQGRNSTHKRVRVSLSQKCWSKIT